MIRIQTIAILAFLMAGVYACTPKTTAESETKNSETTAQPVREVKLLPSFAMSDAAGKIINLDSFKGKKVFVNLWATWCPPCRAEMPSINELAGKLNKDHVAFVMLSLDEDFEDAKAFVKKHNLQLPVYYPAENLVPMFNTGSIPVTFIFNEAGELVKENTGSDDYNTGEYIDLLTRK